MPINKSALAVLFTLLPSLSTGCVGSTSTAENSDLMDRMDEQIPFMSKVFLWVSQFYELELTVENRQKANQMTLEQKSPIAIAELASIRDMTITSAEGPIPIRVYTPEGDGLLPVFLYIHGGGWWTGNDYVTDSPMTHLAAEAKVIVVSVDYRLAPEFSYPAGFNDCYAVLEWLSRNAKSIGGDGSRLAIGGGSAGANLSAAITLRARNEAGPKIAFQYLMVPALDLSGTIKWDSMEDIGAAYPVMKRWGEAAMTAYAPDPESRLSPYVSPLLAQSFSDLPPALIVTAEFDGLRDQGEAYGEKLRQAGVPVKVVQYDDAFHAFVRSPDKLMDNISQAAVMLSAVFMQ